MNEGVLEIQLTHLDGVAVLALRGEIDAFTARQLREAVQRACEIGVPVVLDMALVTFMDSAGVSALLVASGLNGGLSSKVQVQRPSDAVRRILSIAGLDAVLLQKP